MSISSISAPGRLQVSFSISESLDELSQLAETAGLEVVGSTYQRLDVPNPKTYGKSWTVARRERERVWVMMMMRVTIVESLFFFLVCVKRQQWELARRKRSSQLSTRSGLRRSSSTTSSAQLRDATSKSCSRKRASESETARR